MAVRITLNLERSEYEELQRMARERGLSVADYVHRVIALAREQASGDCVASPIDIEKKLEAVRAAACHQFPTADIEDMLDAISGKTN